MHELKCDTVSVWGYGKCELLPVTILEVTYKYAHGDATRLAVMFVCGAHREEIRKHEQFTVNHSRPLNPEGDEVQQQKHMEPYDRGILAERVKRRAERRTGPMVGDFIKFNDGTYQRLALLWDGILCQPCNDGSFYFGAAGGCELSGSLNQGIDAEKLTQIDEQRWGGVWFFKMDHHTAHNGVNVQIQFPVYSYDGPPPAP